MDLLSNRLQSAPQNQAQEPARTAQLIDRGVWNWGSRGMSFAHPEGLEYPGSKGGRAPPLKVDPLKLKKAHPPAHNDAEVEKYFAYHHSSIV